MQSFGVLISRGISPHVQSASAWHASSAPGDAVGAARSVPGVALWLTEGVGVGAMTTVAGCPSDLHATIAKITTRALFMRVRLYTPRMKRAFLALLISCTPARVPLVLDTPYGAIHCELDRAHAPRATRMVTELASSRYYDGLAFFRRIPGVLVQTGSPTNDGSNGSLERIPVEGDASRLARPGVLILARYTPPPDRVDPNPPRDGRVIGAQLVIGLVDMSHLAGNVTVVGACRDLEVATRISGDRAAAKILRARTAD